MKKRSRSPSPKLDNEASKHLKGDFLTNYYIDIHNFSREFKLEIESSILKNNKERKRELKSTKDNINQKFDLMNTKLREDLENKEKENKEKTLEKHINLYKDYLLKNNLKSEEMVDEENIQDTQENEESALKKWKMSEIDWNKLTKDVWLTIFSFLEFTQLVEISLICKNWKRLSRQLINVFLIEASNQKAEDMTRDLRKLNEAFPRIEVLFIEKINMQMTKELAKIKSLRRIEFTKPSIYTNALKDLPPHLEALVLESGKNLKEGDLQKLPPGLKSLTIKDDSHFNTTIVESLPQTLERLVLSKAKFTYGMLTKLPKSMKYLELVNCRPNKENGQKLSDVKLPDYIEEIHLTDNKWIADNFPSKILPSSLKILNLDRTGVTHFEGKLPSELKSLTLRSNRKAISGTIFEALPNSLESLYIQGVELDVHGKYFFPNNLLVLDIKHFEKTSVIPYSSLNEKCSKLKICVDLTNFPETLLKYLPSCVTSLSIQVINDSEENFAALIKSIPPHLKHISFCGTEINNNHLFLFPATLESIKITEQRRGWVSNKKDYTMLPGSIKSLTLGSPSDSSFTSGFPPGVRSLKIFTTSDYYHRRRGRIFISKSSIGESFYEAVSGLHDLEELTLVNYIVDDKIMDYLPLKARLRNY